MWLVETAKERKVIGQCGVSINVIGQDCHRGISINVIGQDCQRRARWRHSSINGIGEDLLDDDGWWLELHMIDSASYSVFRREGVIWLVELVCECVSEVSVASDGEKWWRKVSELSE